MAYTVPTTRTDGDIIGAAGWNADLVENIKFLADPPRCFAYRSSDLSITTATETILTLNAEGWDTDSMHSTSSNAGRFTAVTAGTYLVSLTVFFAAATTGYRNCRIWFNGVGVTLLTEATNDSPSSTTNTALFCQKEVALGVGDYIENSVLHTRGSSLNVLGSTERFTFCQARMISRS